MDDRWLRRAGIGPVGGRTLHPGISFFDWTKNRIKADPEIVWLGHASFLIRWRGVTLVVDPVFEPWIGPFRRMVPVPPPACFGMVDAVLVSHGHMDHLQSRSILSCDPRRIILPRRTERLLPRGIQDSIPVSPIDLGATESVGGLTVRAVPARHGGWRYPWQTDYFACGFLIGDGDRWILVSGDTAYGPHFSEIAGIARIDWALLPIGAYSPQWFLKSRHLSPPEVVQAWRDLGCPGLVFPHHFGTYRISWEPLSEPLPWFSRLADGAGMAWRLPIGLPEPGSR